MAEPLVTVMMSFYNCEKTLLDAVRSIFAQTFQDWELILLDGGSSDNSLEVAKSINDPRVRVFGDGSYHNHPTALNRLIDLARGKYIARMDGDDFCSPKRLEKQLELFKKDERDPYDKGERSFKYIFDTITNVKLFLARRNFLSPE